jgi:hypothetical protein
MLTQTHLHYWYPPWDQPFPNCSALNFQALPDLVERRGFLRWIRRAPKLHLLTTFFTLSLQLA